MLRLGFLVLWVSLGCVAQAERPVHNTYEPELPRPASRGTLAIKSADSDADRVRLSERLELTVDLSASFDNPFDPDEIDVRARFTLPNRRAVEVLGFFYHPIGT